MKYLRDILTEPSTFAGLAAVMMGISDAMQGGDTASLAESIGVITAGAIAMFRREFHGPR